MNEKVVMTDVEVAAGEHAGRVLTLVEAGRSEELFEFVRSLTPDDVVYALFATAKHLIEQETANAAMAETVKSLADRNRVLENGNAALFAERRSLSGRVESLTARMSEMESIRSDQAEMIARLKESVRKLGGTPG